MAFVLAWMVLSLQGTLSTSAQTHQINLARFYHAPRTGGNDLAFQLHKRLGAKIPDSGGSLQDAEVRRLPVLSQLLDRVFPVIFPKSFHFS